MKKRELFRLLVDTFDSISFWFEKKYNTNPKKAILERQQDLIPVKKLEKTIGKSLGVKNENRN